MPSEGGRAVVTSEQRTHILASISNWILEVKKLCCGLKTGTLLYALSLNYICVYNYVYESMNFLM